MPASAPRRIPAPFLAAALIALTLNASACNLFGPKNDPEPDPTPSGTVAGHVQATEAVLRAIPDTAIAAARTGLRVAYQHTSHGTHVAYGVFGLPHFKSGDAVRFGITNNTEAPDANKLDFHDYAFAGTGYPDLSQADGFNPAVQWPIWTDQVRAYLDRDATESINVMMWSWCDIAGHSVPGYLAAMQTLIDEYGVGGSKIGGSRTTPVTFIFMTGHANGIGFEGSSGPDANIGPGNPKEQAKLIVDYCAERGYWCLDYYDIDTHDMAGNYWEDAGDDGESDDYVASLGVGAVTSGNFYADWQNGQALGSGWYENLDGVDRSHDFGEHLSQDITANRKAFAFWWLAARIAGWQP